MEGVIMRMSLTAFLVLIGPVVAVAAPPECDRLSGKAAETAAAVLDSEYMYDCCDQTIRKCMSGAPACVDRAASIAAHVCRLAAGGADRGAIVRSLEKRAMSVTGRRTAQNLAAPPEGAVAGDAGAPVIVLVYTCARCPFCSKLVPQLRAEVETGRLKGVARLVMRPFPIKSHQNSAEANQALAAAIMIGRGWPFLMEAYRRFDSFKVGDIPAIAAAAGMEAAKFQAAASSDASRQALVDSKKEGLRLGVDSTPTIFIDGRKYESELDVETVVDVILEVASGQKGQAGSLK